jgi:hypothetical protein
MGRQGWRRMQLLDHLKQRRCYWKLKEEALCRTVWRTGCGPVVGETAERMINSDRYQQFHWSKISAVAWVCPTCAARNIIHKRNTSDEVPVDTVGYVQTDVKSAASTGGMTVNYNVAMTWTRGQWRVLIYCLIHVMVGSGISWIESRSVSTRAVSQMLLNLRSNKVKCLW